MSWIYYLLEANFYLVIFYLLYYFVFRSETWYQLNRAYLLISSFLSFVIPFVQLGFLKPLNERIFYPSVIMQRIQQPMIVKNAAINVSNYWSFGNYCLAFYLLIVGILFVNLFIKIHKLIKLSRTNKHIPGDSYTLIETAGERDAFSFFNYVFVSAELASMQTIIRHELIHVRQKHSWDIIYVEALKIFNWFNPLVYLLQYSIKELHEFIADKETVDQENNTGIYTDFLVNNAYGINENALINTFFNKSLIKKRIIMLHQKPSGNLARLKHLIIIPVFAALLCFSTLGFSKTYGWVDLAPHQKNSNATTRAQRAAADSTIVHSNSYTNAKGYKIHEKAILENGKFSSEVSITDKDGNTVIYFKEKTTPDERKMILEKYGYEFPKIKITNVLLAPPPPLNKPKVPPPPPPAPPHKPKKNSKDKNVSVVLNATPAGIKHPAPPPPPAQIIINDPDTSKATSKSGPVHAMLYSLPKDGDPDPLILVNGVRYNLKVKLRPGEHIYIASPDSTITYYTPGDLRAKSRWGNEANNGVIELFGHPSITIK